MIVVTNVQVSTLDEEYQIKYLLLQQQDQNYRLSYYVKFIDLLTINPEHRLKKRVKQLESERSEDLEEIHRQWLLELQKERALISLSDGMRQRNGWITSKNCSSP
jgi:hypothetical protein